MRIKKIDAPPPCRQGPPLLRHAELGRAGPPPKPATATSAAPRPRASPPTPRLFRLPPSPCPPSGRNCTTPICCARVAPLHARARARRPPPPPLRASRRARSAAPSQCSSSARRVTPPPSARRPPRPSPPSPRWPRRWTRELHARATPAAAAAASLTSSSVRRAVTAQQQRQARDAAAEREATAEAVGFILPPPRAQPTAWRTPTSRLPRPKSSDSSSLEVLELSAPSHVCRHRVVIGRHPPLAAAASGDQQCAAATRARPLLRRGSRDPTSARHAAAARAVCCYRLRPATRKLASWGPREPPCWQGGRPQLELGWGVTEKW